VAKAFRTIFKGGRIARRIRTDLGREYRNKLVNACFKEEGVLHMLAQTTELKASYSERVIKSLKLRIHRYFTHKQTYHYIDRLQDFAHSYNVSSVSRLKSHRVIRSKCASNNTPSLYSKVVKGSRLNSVRVTSSEYHMLKVHLPGSIVFAGLDNTLESWRS
jgi:hypothetical protein